MSLDLTVLKLLKRRDRYDRLAGAIPPGALDSRTAIILADFGRFFRDFPDAVNVDKDTFPFWFKSIHPGLKPEALAVFDQLFKDMQADVTPEIEAGLMPRLVSAAAAVKMTKLLERFAAGEEVDLHRETVAITEEYEKQVDKKVKNPQVLDPIEDLLKAEENNEGLPWPLNCLNRHIKPMVGGDFIVVAMRPDKGKTTFCAHLATHAAPYVDRLYPGRKRSILWLNNEGPGKRIVTRCFQAALDATVEDLVKLSNMPSTDPKYKTKIREEYARALGGRPGVLRIFDIHGFWNHEVEDLIRLYDPALIIFDMVDNIKFGGEAANNGQRTDQLLEAMYQWARFMAVKHDTAVIANSQISADGDGLQYPTLPMLKDSKTGKQGAADVILTGGAVNDPVLVNSRYWGTTKNKKQRTGLRGSPMAETLLDGDRARYREIGEGETKNVKLRCGIWQVTTTFMEMRVDRFIPPPQGTRTQEQLDNLLGRAKSRNTLDILRAMAVNATVKGAGHWPGAVRVSIKPVIEAAKELA
jgi:replicative DNA helicase